MFSQEELVTILNALRQWDMLLPEPRDLGSEEFNQNLQEKVARMVTECRLNVVAEECRKDEEKLKAILERKRRERRGVV